jgi:DNA-binding IclR family transcriptional regulator
LLTTVRNCYYSPGPQIIEMDLQIGLADPLLLASQGVLEELVDKVGHSALLLTACHDVSVLCVEECRTPLGPVNRWSRGQRRPLFQGAGSKVILAHLPHHRFKAIYARDATKIENAGLGSTWGDFRKTLAGIKRDGYLLTTGEFNPGVHGIAAPIFNDQKGTMGSVGVAWDERARRDIHLEHAVLAVKQAACTVSDRLLAVRSLSVLATDVPGA